MGSNLQLGKIQHFIVQYLWTVGEATAREVSDAVAKEHGLAHSTVQTLLRKLEQKGAIIHSERDRIFYFKAVVQQTAVEQSSTREFLNRVFKGSAAGLVSHMLKHEQFSTQELEEIRQLIEGHAKEEQG